MLPKSRLVHFLAALSIAAAFLPASAQEPEGLYAKQEDWTTTLTGMRARYLEWKNGEDAVRPVTFEPWYTTGPLQAKGFKDALFPEKGVDLQAREGDKRLWTAELQWKDGEVINLPSDGESKSTYLFRKVVAAKPARITASFGSDDGLEVFLNGKKVLSNDVPRIAEPNQDRLDLELAQGENQLLLKIFNRSGGHAFYFAGVENPLPEAWAGFQRDFPREAQWILRDCPNDSHLNWFGADAAFCADLVNRALGEATPADAPLRAEAAALAQAQAGAEDARWLDVYGRTCRIRDARANLDLVNLEALRRAASDLKATYGDGYLQGVDVTARLDAADAQRAAVLDAFLRGDAASIDQAEADVTALAALKNELLLANPLLDFDRLLVIKRNAGRLGLPQNWQGNCSVGAVGYDNEIAVLSPATPGGALTTLYRPEGSNFVGDVDLHYDADRMLVSMPDAQGLWQIWEISGDGKNTRQLTQSELPGINNYDACYLPDGRIIFDSTRVYQGIPCVGGSDSVANLFIMDADGGNIRQLCFDQDHDWCPTVLNNGRVMYTRWEYSDTPHYFSRLLFHMNPDGTNQAEYYGSNSFWPNSIFYARPIPNHPSAVAAIVSGHHGVPRMGELVIFDPARGRHEGDGVVQRIPGHGQPVEPKIEDQLVQDSWPRFLHPWPLNDKYLLVSCQPTPQDNWGIYLVDVFDNLLLISEQPGYALFEPVPFRKTTPPPIVPDKVKLDRDDATVYLTDVYRGPGLKDVPRGEIKKLRIYEFHYSYNRMGGHVNVGVEGPWDVHRILGTVPVNEDGSAMFRVPANMPLAVQPLDGEGKAVQVMRSWFTAMPGEVISCAGCHEKQNSVPAPMGTLAGVKAPDEIAPWYGPARGFSFKREVQPVLNKYCVGCHNGQPRPNGKTLLDFTEKAEAGWGGFTPSYLALHPYVRRPGPESDYRLQVPYEWHADTSELVQMLQKGHHGVELDAEAWDRLVTWIDLNVPDHGTWHEHREIPAEFHKWRMEMRAKYANRPEDPEAIPAVNTAPVEFIPPQNGKEPAAPAPAVEGWPFDAAQAAALRDAAGLPATKVVDLGNGMQLEMVLVPAGTFVMGDSAGAADEHPLAPVTVDKPFYMGRIEVTNEQFQTFDPEHHNGVIDQHNKDHTTRGYPVDGPKEPVIRVTWEQAMAFCQWLTEKAGQPFALPTEAQWEWACRAGSATPFYYGDRDTDFSTFANLADLNIRKLAVAGINPQPIENPSPFEDFLPKDDRFDDGVRLMAEAGRYQPNAWGLCDMHGNVAEWTLTDFAPYPYSDADGRNSLSTDLKKVVRGGSWMDRPKRARAGFRLAYRPYQRVYNVGFRVICAAE